MATVQLEVDEMESFLAVEKVKAVLRLMCQPLTSDWTKYLWSIRPFLRDDAFEWCRSIKRVFGHKLLESGTGFSR